MSSSDAWLRAGIRRASVVLAFAAALIAPCAAVAAPTWVGPITISPEAEGATLSTLYVDDNGTMNALWGTPGGSDWGLRTASRTPGGAWQVATTTSTSGGVPAEAEMIPGPHGDIHAIWRATPSGTIRSATWIGGRAWSATQEFNVPGLMMAGPHLAVDQAGNVVAVWAVHGPGTFRMQSATRRQDGSWSPAVDVAPTAAGGYPGGVAVETDGQPTAAWSENAGSSYPVKVSHRSADGSWGAPVTVSAPGRFGFRPVVASDNTGRLCVAWFAQDGADYRIQAAVRSASGTWGTPVDLSAAGQDAGLPNIVGDGAGNFTVTWQSATDTTLRVQAATLTADGVAHPASDLSDPAQDGHVPVIAALQDGTVAVAWKQTSSSTSRVMASTRASNGTWSAGVPLSPAGAEPSLPSIVADRAGNLAVLWSAANLSGEPLGGLTSALQASGLDGSGPLLNGSAAPQVPATGQTGQPVPLSAAPVDVWSNVSDVSWDTGAGTTVTGRAAKALYGKSGTYTVGVTARDTAGNATTSRRQITITRGPATILGRTVKLAMTLPRKGFARRCPASSALHLSLRTVKYKLTIAHRTLTVKKVGGACRLTGTVRLRRTVKQGLLVTTTVTSRKTRKATATTTGL